MTLGQGRWAVGVPARDGGSGSGVWWGLWCPLAGPGAGGAQGPFERSEIWKSDNRLALPIMDWASPITVLADLAVFMRFRGPHFWPVFGPLSRQPR